MEYNKSSKQKTRNQLDNNPILIMYKSDICAPRARGPVRATL